MNPFCVVILALFLQVINSQFTLLVFGDIGEFEEFKDSQGSTDADPSVFKLDETAKTCTKLAGTWKGYLNFLRLINADINSQHKFSCNADSVAILGDLIYPEVKHDTIKTQRAYQLKVGEARYPGWRARVVCALFVLKDVLNTINCPANSQNPFGSKDANGLFNKVDLLLGNHSFDVDYTVEADYSLRLTNYNAYSFNTATPAKDILASQSKLSPSDISNFPVMKVQTIGDVRVEFLDFIILPLSCYLTSNPKTEDQYNKCWVFNLYGIFYTFQQAQTYTERFIQALGSFTQTANWRVLRAHHPMMNIEGYPGDYTVFWKVAIDSSGNTIMDLVKQNNINLFLGSHHHSSQVLVYPWANLPQTKSVYSTYDVSGTIGFSTKIFDLQGTECPKGNCPKDSSQCYYNDIFLNGKSEIKVCDNVSRSMTLKLNPSAPKNLITIIQGGSGRKLDIIENDQKTPAVMIFGRAFVHAGCQIVFNKRTFKVTFFEGENIVLTLTSVDSLNDNYPVIENYVKAKLENSLGRIQTPSANSTDPVVYSINSFNFTGYVDVKSGFILRFGYLLLAGLIYFFI